MEMQKQLINWAAIWPQPKVMLDNQNPANNNGALKPKTQFSIISMIKTVSLLIFNDLYVWKKGKKSTEKATSVRVDSA